MKGFLKFPVYTLLVLSAFFTACDSKKVQPDGSVVVSVNKSARIGQSVTLKVLKIEDSRCPTNVNCVWAGNARVFFALEADNETQNSELCLGDCKPTSKASDKAIVQLGGTEYEVLLKDVTPYPIVPATDTKPKESEATIQVTARK